MSKIKNILIIFVFLLICNPAKAKQEDSQKISFMPRISGYLQTGWNYSSGKSTFRVNRFRATAQGYLGSRIQYKFQGNFFATTPGIQKSTGAAAFETLDAYLQLNIRPGLKIRAGQFYIPLGYEIYDISSRTCESVYFSALCYKMASRNPYEYNCEASGLDVGVMLLGDVFDTGEGWSRLNYSIAVTNGSGSANKDVNNSKDIYISGTWNFSKYLSVKANYNYGKYKSREFAGYQGVGSGDHNPLSKFVAGFRYDKPGGLFLRAEAGIMKSLKTDEVREQGAYCIAGWHFNKFQPFIRWDAYNNQIIKSSPDNFNRMLGGLMYNLIGEWMKISANYGRFFYKKETGLGGADEMYLILNIYF